METILSGGDFILIALIVFVVCLLAGAIVRRFP